MPSSPIVRYCTTADGVRVAFEQLGTGPPILKSANWMSHLDEDRDSPLWRHWLSLLSDGRQLTRFDGRGSGLSEREPPTLTFEGLLADMEAVADAAALERFPILGFCHGGPLAIAYAVRHPARVSALVLCGTYGQGRAVRSPTPDDAAERQLLLNLIELGWGQDSPAYRQVFATRAARCWYCMRAATIWCPFRRVSCSHNASKDRASWRWTAPITTSWPTNRHGRCLPRQSARFSASMPATLCRATAVT
jgi:pimeloyl-ACP methyl ester carboxylesterase